MSDHRERACQHCGCLLHHKDRCPQKERDDKRNATCCRGCGRPFPDELRARITALETALRGLCEAHDVHKTERDQARRDAVELSDALLHPWRKRDDAPLAARLAQYREALEAEHE